MTEEPRPYGNLFKDEEQGTARERLRTRIAAEIPVPEDGSAFAIAEDVIDRVLRCLPLVLEAAQEAGKAESVEGEETYDGEKWWRLLDDSEEQT